MKRKKQLETTITQEIIEYLEKMGYIVKRIYNGGIPGGINRKTGQVRYRKKSDRDKGIPDLLAIHPELKAFWFIEVKSPKGRLRPEQEEFISAFNNCTFYQAIVVRSLNSLKEYLGHK